MMDSKTMIKRQFDEEISVSKSFLTEKSRK